MQNLVSLLSGLMKKTTFYCNAIPARLKLYCVVIKMHNGVCVNVWFNLKREDELWYFVCSGRYKCHVG
ncbi:hypothetical protein Hanom_Chr14g01252521 [Helianthus anomalus]